VVIGGLSSGLSRIQSNCGGGHGRKKDQPVTGL
jgi:hypothetical protein